MKAGSHLHLNLNLPLNLNPSAASEIEYTRKSKIKSVRLSALWFLLLASSAWTARGGEMFPVLSLAAFAHHIERLNTMEDENVTNHVSNAQSWAWLQRNIPFFECPDREVEEMYYFRWWSFRKHLVKTPRGFVFTEFLPRVSHAGAFNTISCAVGHHLAEGRWLRDDRYLNDYTRFWLRGNRGKPQPHFHKYSNWFAAAAWERYLVNGNKKFVARLLPDLVADYRVWEAERQLTNGLFWQYDVRDGMEESVSGSRTNQNIRPTINSYMFANARDIAAIARLAKKPKLAAEFEAKAAALNKLALGALWDTDAEFFKAGLGNGQLSDVREEIGFIPWMFGLPGADQDYEAAWLQFTDPQGFHAPFGITTAERRHPEFRSHGVGTCEWDGAVWPFATSQTLTALANVLRPGVAATPRRSPVSATPSSRARTGIAASPRRATYFDAFLTCVHSQHADGKPYIGEYLDEVTGDWINGKNGRSRYYNHSTFADLLITGVIGLRPRADSIVEIHPLLPDDAWDWFCLDGVKYHGHTLTIIWDQTGARYGLGKGLLILADGKEIAHANSLKRISGQLP